MWLYRLRIPDAARQTMNLFIQACGAIRDANIEVSWPVSGGYWRHPGYIDFVIHSPVIYSPKRGGVDQATEQVSIDLDEPSLTPIPSDKELQKALERAASSGHWLNPDEVGALFHDAQVLPAVAEAANRDYLYNGSSIADVIEAPPDRVHGNDLPRTLATVEPAERFKFRIYHTMLQEKDRSGPRRRYHCLVTEGDPWQLQVYAASVLLYSSVNAEKFEAAQEVLGKATYFGVDPPPTFTRAIGMYRPYPNERPTEFNRNLMPSQYLPIMVQVAETTGEGETTQRMLPAINQWLDLRKEDGAAYHMRIADKEIYVLFEHPVVATFPPESGSGNPRPGTITTTNGRDILDNAGQALEVLAQH